MGALLNLLLVLVRAFAALLGFPPPLGGPAGSPSSSGTSASGAAPAPTTAPTPPNTPPRITLAALTGTIGVPVPVRYTLADDESDAARIEVQYSIDGGATFRPARQDRKVRGDGASQLRTDPAGVAHLFAWDARADLGDEPTSGVIVRVAAFDTQPGGVATSGSINVDPSVIALPSVPGLFVFTPKTLGKQVPVWIILWDRDSEPVRVEVDCARDGTTLQWAPAYAAPTSDDFERVPAPDIDADYRFIWDAARHFPAQAGRAHLRFTLYKGPDRGGRIEVGPFDFDTRIVRPALALSPRPDVTPTLTIISGNNQRGIAGRLLPERLVVRVTDPQNGRLAGVRISFSAAPNSVPFDFVRDPRVWTTTNAAGEAAIKVRPRRGANGAGEVIAKIVGYPGKEERSQFTVDPPKIDYTGLPTGALPHGALVSITVGYGDVFQPRFEPEPLQPLRLKVEGTNVVVNRRELRLGEAGFQTSLSFVPLYSAGGTGNVRITDVDDPTIFKDIPLRIEVPPGAARHRARPESYRADGRCANIASPVAPGPNLRPRTGRRAAGRLRGADAGHQVPGRPHGRDEPAVCERGARQPARLHGEADASSAGGAVHRVPGHTVSAGWSERAVG